jgi:hypothetical protein
MPEDSSQLSHLERFPLIRLRAAWTVRERVELRGFHGNTVRGLVGSALRDAVCEDRRRDCSECSGRRECPWLYLFRTSDVHDLLARGGRATPPSPLVVEPASGGSVFHPGDTFRIETVLVGDGQEHLEALLRALRRAGSVGLGRHRAGMRLRHVDYVRGSGRSCAYGPRGKFCRPPFEPILGAVAPPVDLASEERSSVVIRLCTPLRIKRRGELLTEVDFAELVEAARWRIALLGEFYAPDVPIPSAERVEELVSRCTTSAVELDSREEWRDKGRERCPAGGITGHLVVEGDWGPLVPLLRLAEQVHAGKGATRGLGKIVLG